MRIYKPEEVLQFKHFSKQPTVIGHMASMARFWRDSGASTAAAFNEAMEEAFAWTVPLLQDVSVVRRYERFEGVVKWAGRDVRDFQRILPKPFRTRLSRHFEERVCLDPYELLCMASERPEADSRSIRYRRYYDALRQMSIANIYWAIEVADRDRWVSQDLREIGRLVREQLFEPGDGTNIWIAAEIDPRHGHARRVHLFDSLRSQSRFAKKVAGRGVKLYLDHMLCRKLKVNGKTYYAFVDGRWKESNSMMLKLLEDRVLTDRRGWSLCVVAVETRRGMRAATHEDAVEFNEVCRERLWIGPLSADPPDLTRNDRSHPGYRDDKIVGRFRTLRDQFLSDAMAEQLTMSIGNRIDTITRRDGVNHDLYRNRRAVNVLGPLYFPPHIYGIYWPTFPKPGEQQGGSSAQKNTARILEDYWLGQIRY